MLVNFISLMVSVYSSASESTNFFLHLQLLLAKYSPILQDLSHSHSQLLGFQINPLLHTFLSINSLHSHLHFSSFHCCFLLQIIPFNLHMHLHVSYHFIYLVSLVSCIKLNTVAFKFFIISGVQILAYGSLILLQLYYISLS